MVEQKCPGFPDLMAIPVLCNKLTVLTLSEESKENSNLDIFHMIISIVSFYMSVSLSYTYALDPAIKLLSNHVF